METIFAEGTPPGRGGVSVVRISGPDARRAVERLAGPLPEPRRTYLRALRDGDDLIDRAMVIRFDSGASFTGEEIAELQLHGAPVIIARVEAALLSYGLRRAEAGEFTRRAFINGCLDLASAEGLADLLAAETEAQRRLAVRASEGEVGRTIDGLRQKLIRAGALVEASIDFADEEVPEDVPDEVHDLLDSVRQNLTEMLAKFPATERLRQGYEVAIIGPPNAGKSTLINAIAKREIALVSNIAGTTRDIIELRTDLRGLPVTFLDTAGLRDSSDSVEQLGIARARARAQSADLRIHLSENGEIYEGHVEGDLVVRSKADIPIQDSKISVSAATGKGVSELLDEVYTILRHRAADSGIVSHKRQAEAIERALNILLGVSNILPEFLAESIRQANLELAAMIGRVGAEDYLDEIFSSFCIGK